jgi:hypothetical protein
MEHSHVRGTLEISVRAQTASLAQVRRLLRPFLAEHHVREDQRHGVVRLHDGRRGVTAKLPLRL